MIPRDTTPAFTAAEFQAALELFGPDPGAAERARELELAIRSPEGTPNGQLSQPKESLGQQPFHPIPIIAPDLLMALSLVNPALETKVRSYINASGLITGLLAERWEAQRSRLKAALAGTDRHPRK